MNNIEIINTYMFKSPLTCGIIKLLGNFHQRTKNKKKHDKNIKNDNGWEMGSRKMLNTLIPLRPFEKSGQFGRRMNRTGPPPLLKPKGYNPL